MKKKLFCILLALGLLAALAACSDGGGDQETDSPAPSATPAGTTQTPSTQTKFSVSYNGVTFAVNDDMADVHAALGEEQSYFEAESCAFEGLDKTYTYPGMVITTRPEGEKDFVQSIRLTDDTITTAEGVCIGMSAADAAAAYQGIGSAAGDPSADGLLSYTLGDTSVNLLVEGGMVTSIEYLAE